MAVSKIYGNPLKLTPDHPNRFYNVDFSQPPPSTGRVAAVDRQYFDNIRANWQQPTDNTVQQNTKVLNKTDLSEAFKNSERPFDKPAAKLDSSKQVTNSLKDVGTSALGAGAFGVVSAGIGGVFNYASGVHRDNTMLAMQQKDYDAAHSIGLASPLQIPNSGFLSLRNGQHAATSARTIGPSIFQ